MSSIEDLTPSEVADRLKQDESAVYLDVRTVEEFREGHPLGAINIPIVERHPMTGMPVMNPDFLPVCEAHLSREATIFVGCASGQRSLQAAGLLRRAGYARLANVDGGFSGQRDPLGNLLRPGWRDVGLPSASGDGEERSYRALRAGLEGAGRERT